MNVSWATEKVLVVLEDQGSFGIPVTVHLVQLRIFARPGSGLKLFHGLCQSFVTTVLAGS